MRAMKHENKTSMDVLFHENKASMDALFQEKTDKNFYYMLNSKLKNFLINRLY